MTRVRTQSKKGLKQLGCWLSFIQGYLDGKRSTFIEKLRKSKKNKIQNSILI